MKVEKVYARNLRVAQNRGIDYPRGATNIKFILHRRLGAEKALKCARNHANWHVKDVDRTSSARRRFGSSLGLHIGYKLNFHLKRACSLGK